MTTLKPDDPMPRVQTRALRWRGILVVPHYTKPVWVLPGGQEFAWLPGAEPEVTLLWPRPHDLGNIQRPLRPDQRTPFPLIHPPTRP